jgi:hypothetical protein
MLKTVRAGGSNASLSCSCATTPGAAITAMDGSGNGGMDDNSQFRLRAGLHWPISIAMIAGLGIVSIMQQVLHLGRLGRVDFFLPWRGLEQEGGERGDGIDGEFRLHVRSGS